MNVLQELFTFNYTAENIILFLSKIIFIYWLVITRPHFYMQVFERYRLQQMANNFMARLAFKNENFAIPDEALR